MRDELIDTFLYELTRPGYQNQVCYETCRLILMGDESTFSGIASRLAERKPIIVARVQRSCNILGLEKAGIMSLRVAYMRFLEDEIEILGYAT